QRMTRSRMKLQAVLDAAIQAANALDAAHAAGITHRDIKPENIMVRRDGYIKVFDFGLAKLTEQTDAIVDTDPPTILSAYTSSGVLIGTVRYMSPEQARGHRVDARTDIFSLGVVIYEVVAGLAPFSGATMSDVIAAILKDEPPPLRRRMQNVP